MLSLTVKEMRGHGRRLVVTALAVFLGVAFLADGRVAGHLDDPTPQTVLDSLTSLKG